MPWYYFFIAGLASGILSGMGMGGGTILIPALTLLLGISQHAAQGLNMLAFLPGAVIAIIVHKKGGRLEVKKALPLLYMGAAGAIAGALIATQLDAQWLKKAFGLFLIVLAGVQWKKGNKAGEEHI